jgi:hypothetical protein
MDRLSDESESRFAAYVGGLLGRNRPPPGTGHASAAGAGWRSQVFIGARRDVTGDRLWKLILVWSNAPPYPMNERFMSSQTKMYH